LSASELAWRRCLRGGTPTLDLAAGSRVVRILPRLAAERVIAAAHDVSVGGVAVALARMAIAAATGAEVALPAKWPTAALFGERPGRVIAALDPARAPRLRAALDEAGIPGRRIGVAGGQALRIGLPDASIDVEIVVLERAWRTDFGVS
jgi:phosphoribosylformylglycinamidine synthase